MLIEETNIDVQKLMFLGIYAVKGLGNTFFNNNAAKNESPTKVTLIK